MPIDCVLVGGEIKCQVLPIAQYPVVWDIFYAHSWKHTFWIIFKSVNHVNLLYTFLYNNFRHTLGFYTSIVDIYFN